MNTRLGLSVSSDFVQAVELERDGPGIRLTAIGEWHGATPDGATVLGDRLRAFMAANGAHPSDAAVAIDTRRMFIHTFPDNSGTPRETIRAHASWELAQFFPAASADDHITDIAPIGLVSPDGIQDYLVVSLLRRDVHNIRMSVESAGMNLAVLDADHFGAETLALQRHDGAASECVLLAGVKDDRLDWSILDRGTVTRYAATVVTTPGSVVDLLVAASREGGGVQRILLYGPALTPEIRTRIVDSTELPTEILDPFSTLTIAPDLPLAGHFLNAPHRFAAAVGIALREE